MPFSFGGSKSSSRSSSSSRAFDVGVSGSVSGGLSESESRAASRDRVAFEDVFSRLFGGAEGAAAGLDPSLLTSAANQLFSGGLDFLSSLGGGGPERAFLEGRVAGEDGGLLDEQIGLLSEDVGRFFSEQLNPAITSEAIAGGQLGGGRQGVAQGIAAGEAGSAFARGASALRAADLESRDRSAVALGQQRLTSAEKGLNGLSTLAGIADLGFGAGLAPFERLAGILGGPTVLGESESRSTATAEDFARAFSQNFGFSRADATSTSRSRSASIGF